MKIEHLSAHAQEGTGPPSARVTILFEADTIGGALKLANDWVQTVENMNARKADQSAAPLPAPTVDHPRPDAPSVTVSRRRRTIAPDAINPSAKTASTAAPTSRHRRSASVETAAAASPSVASTTDAPTGVRAPKPVSTEPAAPIDISDADLAKAASQAAAIVTPAPVIAYLGEFGVTEVSKLSQDLRREFLDGLKALVAEVATGK